MLRKTLDNLPNSRPYLIVTAVGVVLFYPTWLRLIFEWLKFEQVLAHGLATGLIFIGLLLVHPPRPVSSPAPGNRVWPGVALLFGITMVWALLELVRIDTLSYLMLPAGMLAACWVLLGLRSALRFLPYVILLSLSLPIWADLIPALVAIASAVVSNWVRLFGMTALIEGNSITLPYGRLVIADGCSGIRYFAISILLAAMMSILNDYRWRGWLVLLAGAMLLGLIANWVRIFILVVIGYETEMQSALLTDHELLGWVVYGIFILPALYFAPVNRRQSSDPLPSRPISRKGVVALVIAFIVGPIGVSLLQLSGKQSAPWSPLEAGLAPEQPDQLPIHLRLPDFLEHKVWKAQDGAWLSLAQSQRSEATDNKLVPYLRPPIDPEQWQLSETQNGVQIYQNRMNRQRVAISQQYMVGTHSTDSYRDAKLWQIPATLKGENRFGLLTVMSECGPRQCTQAIEAVASTYKTFACNDCDKTGEQEVR